MKTNPITFVVQPDCQEIFGVPAILKSEVKVPFVACEVTAETREEAELIHINAHLSQLGLIIEDLYQQKEALIQTLKG